MSSLCTPSRLNEMLFERPPLTETVTAAGKVFVDPWSELFDGALTAPATSAVNCAGFRPFRGSSIIRTGPPQCSEPPQQPGGAVESQGRLRHSRAAVPPRVT